MVVTISKLPTVSIVVPMFNEDLNTVVMLKKVLNELDGTLAGQYIFEKVVIDDGSDETFRDVIKNQLLMSENWTVVHFTRNFGKEAALRAGFEYSTGDAVIPLDADLQDPVELIPRMLELWTQENFPVVLARRGNRTSDKRSKRFFSNAFYRIIAIISDIDIPNNVGDFRLLDRKVVAQLLLMPERNLFMKGMYAWLGYKYAIIEYPRKPRIHGKTKFSFSKLFKFALDGIVSFSSLPLRIWSGIGIIVALISFIYSIVIVVLKLLGKIEIPGYSSLIVISLTALSLNLICFGVFGEYLSRMFIEIKGRPHYIVESSNRSKPKI